MTSGSSHRLASLGVIDSSAGRPLHERPKYARPLTPREEFIGSCEWKRLPFSARLPARDLRSGACIALVAITLEMLVPMDQPPRIEAGLNQE